MPAVDRVKIVDTSDSAGTAGPTPLRSRAHAFEAGGNWVVQGLIKRLPKDDADAEKYRKRYCVYILPMANKDAVARGRTRFNSMGMDLNRN